MTALAKGGYRGHCLPGANLLKPDASSPAKLSLAFNAALINLMNPGTLFPDGVVVMPGR